MPEGDVATVRVAEEALVREVTADFDAAITAQQSLTTTATASANGGEQQQQQHTLALATSRRAAAEATIASCCQLLSLLGRGFVGVERYAAYLRATLSSDIAAELRAAAISGVDFPLAALNTVSALFSKAATALDSADVLGGALFTSGEASLSPFSSSSSSSAAAAVAVTAAATPAASSNGVVVVHSVVDAAAAKVVLSFTRSGRVAAALAGREVVRNGGGGGSQQQQQQQQQRDASGAGGSLRNGPTPHLPPHLTNAMLLALESSDTVAGEDAVLQGPAAYPFALPPIPGGAKPTWEPSGEDFTRPVTLDVFLDELALLLQRCTSYTRLVWARGGKRPAAASASSAAAAAAAAGRAAAAGVVEDASVATTTPTTTPLLTLPDVTPALGKFTRLASATAELTGVYTALECAGAVGGLLCAVALDEVYEDGAAGVSIDLTDPFLPVSLVPAAAAAAAGGAAGGAGGALSGGSSSGGGGGEAASSSSSGGGEKKEKEEGVSAGAMGGGAMVSSLVEDTFFVLLRAGRRAFASGSADAVATVVNSAIVLTLMDRLGNELDARFRVALGQEEGDKEGGGGGKPSSSSATAAAAAGAGGVASFGGAMGGAAGGVGGTAGGLGLASPTAPPLTPEQWERLTLARSALMSTPAVRASHVHIGEFQNITSPGMGGQGAGAGAGGGSSFLSPLGGGGRGGVGGGRGSSAVLSTPLPNSSLGGPGAGGGGGSSSSSSSAVTGSSMLATLTGVGGRVHAINEPVAKLTEETAAAALALNNTQLAAECCCRLKANLEEEAEAVFSDAKLVPTSTLTLRTPFFF
jgi:hypothetical protein